MPWKQTTLSQFLPGANALANELAASLTKKMNSIMLLKAILQMFLSGVIDKINSIQALISALEAQGFYVILLSPSKGNWANRLRFAPNAPPESTSQFNTTGVCVITTAPSFDHSIQAFMSALGALKAGIPMPNFGKGVIKQRSMHTPPRVPKPAIQMDVWKPLTLADLLPGIGAAALDLAGGLLGFIADLQHTVAQIAAFANNAMSLASSATNFITDLNNAGAFAIFLKPDTKGIVDRLVTEDNAPSQDTTLYSVGFCACFYSTNYKHCTEKYDQLRAIFNADIEMLPESYPGALIPGYPETYPSDIVTNVETAARVKIKSWTLPATGYYKNEVWVTLNCNVENAIIYYTLNGQDPRTSSRKMIYTPDSPIYINQNNSVIKHYAQIGINVERRTRESQYKIVMFLDPKIPYSPIQGVLTGVGTIPDTNIADMTIPPNLLWGKEETALANGLKVMGVLDQDLEAGQTYAGEPVYQGDAGTLIRNSINNVVGVAPDEIPPSRFSVVTPDDSDEVELSTKIIDLQYSATEITTDMSVEAGQSFELLNAVVVGSYGEEPWRTNGYPDVGAKWIWNQKTPLSRQFPANIAIQFISTWENTSASDKVLTVYYMADNTAQFYFNNTLMDNDSGWYEYHDKFLSSFQIYGRYRTIEVTAFAESTATFKWNAMNWGGMAGLIFSVFDSNGTLLFNSGNGYEIKCTQTDWHLANVVSVSEQTDLTTLSFSAAVSVYYGLYCRVDVLQLIGSKIDKFNTTDDNGLTISEDKISIEGLVDNVGSFTIPILLENGSVLRLLFMVKSYVADATATEYAPIAHDMKYKVLHGNSIPIQMTARNTLLPMTDSSVNFLVVSACLYGTLSGSGSTLTYTALGSSVGKKEKIEYIARNMVANSSIATIELEIT